MLNFSDISAFLWLALPLGLAAYFLFRKKEAPKSKLYLFPASAPGLKRQVQKTRWFFRGIFLAELLAMGLVITAIARPTEIESWTKKWSESIDIALVLDVSESMEATDLKPNRMTAAKQVIRDFIKNRSDDRIGLIIFGGEAVTKCPLTRDHDFLLEQLEDSRMRELKQGTAIGMGLANGISRLRGSESKVKIIVLITDGDSNVGAINPVTAAHLARQEGIKIYSIGIGKENRVVVPIYSYDLQGRKTQLVAQVPSYINPELLAQISQLTGGKAYMARDNGMLSRILKEIDRLEKTKIWLRPQQKKHEKYLPWAMIALLIFFFSYTIQETRLRKVNQRGKVPLPQTQKNIELTHATSH